MCTYSIPTHEYSVKRVQHDSEYANDDDDDNALVNNDDDDDGQEYDVFPVRV